MGTAAVWLIQFSAGHERLPDDGVGGQCPPVTSAHNVFFLPRGHSETRETVLRVLSLSSSLVSQVETSTA